MLQVKRNFVILSILLIFTVFISGCVDQESPTKSPQPEVQSKPKLATKEPLEMILELSDFPTGQNWTMKSRVERVRSDIDSDARSLGWKKGYAITFMRIGEGREILGIPTDITLLGQLISIYPIENISKVLASVNKFYEDSNYTVDELSKPNIGDDSRAFRLTSTVESSSDVYYLIVFTKMDVYETLQLSGLTIDYELLKDLARKAESKIR